MTVSLPILTDLRQTMQVGWPHLQRVVGGRCVGSGVSCCKCVVRATATVTSDLHVTRSSSRRLDQWLDMAGQNSEVAVSVSPAQLHRCVSPGHMASAQACAEPEEQSVHVVP